MVDEVQQALVKLMVDEYEGAEVLVAMGPYHVWCAVAGLQLACRHPGLSVPMRNSLHRAANALTAALPPDVARLLRLGWDPRRDQRFDSYTCRRCGMTSMHPEDRAQRYCGACHTYDSDADGPPTPPG